MVVIKAQINQFNYFLRFDERGEGLAEGLRDNATQLSRGDAETLINTLESVWPLSIEDLDQQKINKRRAGPHIPPQ